MIEAEHLRLSTWSQSANVGEKEISDEENSGTGQACLEKEKKNMIESQSDETASKNLKITQFSQKWYFFSYHTFEMSKLSSQEMNFIKTCK